jgi:putative DNA methylase
MIEIPPKFAGMPPVNPASRCKLDVRQWKGAQGLAEDVRYYGQWMRDEAEKRIGHLYPKVKITPEMVNDPENPRPDLKPYEGQELTVIAWLWARTVKSPNPAFSQVEVPLASTFMLSTKAGKEVYVQPVIEGGDYRFTVKVGKPENAEKAKAGTKAARANFSCLMSNTPISGDYIKSEGNAGRMGVRLMAVVVEGKRSRIYLAPTSDQEIVARNAKPEWKPEVTISGSTQYLGVKPYGMDRFDQIFTDRQLAALTTFSDLAHEARSRVEQDAAATEQINASGSSLARNSASREYADAISMYLALAMNKVADRNSTVCGWDNGFQKIANTFGRQALSMRWDFAECNAFSGSTGSIDGAINFTSKSLEALPASPPGSASQKDATSQGISLEKVISTDPPYYDNVPYADLSDFFYVWLRRSLKTLFPALFATLSVPKAEELVAFAYRHKNKVGAEIFFLEGMKKAMSCIAQHGHMAFPVTIYYAFRQAEAKGGSGVASTGWETFLTAIVDSGLAVAGTWPMRTEYTGNLKTKRNALASSVVLVCQRRDPNAAILSRNAFRRELRQRLPQAIKELEHANIAPVDVAQAAIGPGMAIFSQAKAVLNPDDSSMSVRDALIEINAALDEHLSQDEGAFDADTRFALTFFESFGYSERPYGDAEGLAVSRNISVDGVVRAGILRAAAGKAQLLRRDQLDDAWNPSQDERLCVWEATQHLIKQLETDGEGGASALLLQLKNLPGQADLAANCRALAYRLYNHCEKTKQAEEARSYNGLVIAWPELERQASAASLAQSVPLQPSLI